jgi:hypothetical protein
MISRLPPLSYIDTELPIPCISWLSRIPDDKRLRFGFPNGILQQLQIEAPYYEVPTDQPVYEYFLPESYHSEISASFEQVDEIAPMLSTRFFVRDNDLWGNNRLYEEKTVKVYHDGEYTYSNTPTMENGDYRWNKYREPISAVDILNTDKNERSRTDPDTTEDNETAQWKRVMYVTIQTLRSTCGAPSKV